MTSRHSMEILPLYVRFSESPLEVLDAEQVILSDQGKNVQRFFGEFSGRMREMPMPSR